MKSSDFIHDPYGVIVFREPTSLRVKSRGVESEAVIRVLPFSRLDEKESGRGDVVWAGHDTYYIPQNAEYTILEDLTLEESEVELHEENNDPISLSDLVNR